jgi:hypothetical protein
MPDFSADHIRVAEEQIDEVVAWRGMRRGERRCWGPSTRDGHRGDRAHAPFSAGRPAHGFVNLLSPVSSVLQVLFSTPRLDWALLGYFWLSFMDMLWL